MTGQVEFVQFHFCLAVGFEDELSVIALAAHGNGQFVRLKCACDAYVRSVHLYGDTVFHLLFHLCLRTVEADGDVFCMAHVACQQGKCARKDDFVIHIRCK